ncbi:DUF6069 family protein [Amycolatopsis decaplanina]|uniref:Uncharacterized protein n=1 Tax=Amycolatopsis decaplanina DSM 44594 TaxID=1284240 RepID=M2Z362_9PSEU|nr:DUF6069 family protein [Amycolatopsis decaplanina]EME55039.1 hypothetical protein H074_26062 [Amycolatopsis decaplanina DSM 44594]
MDNDFEAEEQRTVNAGRLWAGGAATAVTAALTAVVGILVARGLVKVAVLTPSHEGAWGGANTVTYALVSAVVALGATALLHVLLLTTPRVKVFFGWIMVLLTAIAVVTPLSLTAEFDARLATAIINLAIGLVITITLSGVAGSALRERERQVESAARKKETP